MSPSRRLSVTPPRLANGDGVVTSAELLLTLNEVAILSLFANGSFVVSRLCPRAVAAAPLRSLS